MFTKDEIFAHFNFILERELKNSLHARMSFAQYDLNGESDYDFFTDSTVSIKYGATRGAIVDDEYGYVAKFDICGDSRYESGCDREMQIYEHAVDAKLDKYFLRPQYIGCFRYEWDGYSFDDLIDTYGYQNYYYKDEDELRDLISNLAEDVEAKHHCVVMNLYAYPYVSDFGYIDLDIPHESKEYKISVSSSSPLSERYPSIGARFVQSYGEEEFNRLSEFLEWEEVNDLHNGNVAEWNGDFVIVDYAGYHDD